MSFPCFGKWYRQSIAKCAKSGYSSFHLSFIMSQFELFVIDSPCIGVCTLNKKGYCIGCLRSRSERQTWHTLSDDEKHKILTLIAKRARRIQDARRQKRQGELDLFGESIQLDLTDSLGGLDR
ncbi:DUF1289 domain-containing protein [Moraxella nasibovis]|uniref:DUF1289 domain-containing protein n=1 Tax=Moraxella nasibovis TaxID=2904120 RepID=UPI00240F409E|nr:DUF1289 domain-containing protein [Moraxella nasibovis]WFF38609.1 DUF1289 domain-containing protein [Moraxella nasibovis]